jgi:hypothetical protein
MEESGSMFAAVAVKLFSSKNRILMNSTEETMHFRRVLLMFLLLGMIPFGITRLLSARANSAKPLLPINAALQSVGEVSPSNAVVTGNQISYNGGPIMPGAHNVYLIWYGNWAGNDALSILPDLITGLNNSSYFDITTTYGDASGNTVADSLFLGGQFFDSGYSQGRSLAETNVESVVNNALSNGLPKDPHGIYFVLSAADVDASSGSQAFCRDFCGYHDHEIVSGTDIKFAFVGNPDHCPAQAINSTINQCEYQLGSPNSDPAADAMASTIAHELGETITDPDLNGWFSGAAAGGEIGDKCVFPATDSSQFKDMFGPFINAGGSLSYSYNVTLGSRRFLLQNLWLNAHGGMCVNSLNTTSPIMSQTGSSCGASYTAFNGSLIQVWTNTCNGAANQPGQLLIASAPAGSFTVGPPTAIQLENSFLSPAVTVFNNQLYVSWTGTDNGLNVMSSPDGVTWDEATHVRLAQKTQFAPSLAVFNGKLYLGFTAEGGSTPNALSLLSSSDGLTFGGLTTLPPFSQSEFPSETYEWSIGSPSLFSISNERLYVAWASVPETLNYASSLDGVTFGNRVEIGGVTVTSAAGTILNGNLILAAADESNQTLFWVLANTFSAGLPQPIGGTNLSANSLALSPPSSNELFLSWINSAGLSSAGPINIESINLQALEALAPTPTPTPKPTPTPFPRCRILPCPTGPN